ncbi:hypothetical protein lerEdw1_017224 [Lerista edwardsae]|nr:hypothetical protein lerEdw1_017224 [Lerista edwardsae]
MRRVAAGLLIAAALIAVLVDWYAPLGQQQLLVQARSFSADPAPGPEATNLFWIVQASRGEPSDLVDGRTKGELGSDQFEEEWQIYQTILKRSKVMEKTKWLDIKGNHDTFNVPSLESVRNYYRKYSAWQKDGSFHYVHSTPFGKYSFICVDATLNPGPKRPYNFFGILNANQMQELSALSAESRGSNHTIWFGHYPTSTIISPYPGIRTAMRSATAYLCGHFHTVGGLMPVLHTQHRHGTLELELGDWKKSRRYRILAFDHDLFSFADLTFEEWPVVLITNPKPFLYSSSAHEPLQRIRHSTYIRITLYFERDYAEFIGVIVTEFWPSPSPVKFVKVSIDGVDLGDAVQVSGPLYVLKWNPQTYHQGFHKINVTAQDASGKSGTQLHTFAMEENLSLRFDLMPSWLLLTDHYIWFRVVFVVIVFLQIALLVIFRYLRKPTLQGPWFVGEIVDGHMGACFSFGLIVDGQFLEGSITYVVGIVQVLFFNLPLMTYVCWCLLLRCQGHSFRSHLRAVKWYQAAPLHFIMALLFLWQVFSCFFLWQTYGIISFFFSPLRTWLVGLTLLLLYRTWWLKSAALSAFITRMKNSQSSE